ncbi:MAG TPA: methylated-DNA--[protein]-cysteine S-methyltransferase [Thiobacillaceae bacterium]|nr:methylated-DNA--[protein]-cysteine S-methyltransferase [Thiobacillaceae bacterium]
MHATPHAYDAIMPIPCGALGIRIEAGALAGLEFLPAGTPAQAARDPLARRTVREVEAYLSDPMHLWNLPFTASGTAFRQRVWQALRHIPPGRTRSYGDIARELRSSPRAVGQAVGDNPLPMLIPCHRVIAADGGLGGFNHSRTGYSLDIKRWLLGHEGVL